MEAIDGKKTMTPKYTFRRKLYDIRETSGSNPKSI